MAKYKIIPSSRTIVQSPISIGHKAEKGVEAIEFDLTAWVETYGSGTLTVIMRRWGDAIPYPIALEIDENNKATWTLSDIDTAKAGMAYAQLSYIVGETVVKKSDIYTFRVMDSLTGEGEPPEAYESWLENLTHLAAEAMAEVLDIEGIVTDKTLTVDGGIADGKATGDALALKADKATTYTKTEVDGLIEDVEVETDTTLAVSGAPADAKTVGDELAEINESLGDVRADLGQQNTRNLAISQGYWSIADGTPTVSNNWCRTGAYIPKNLKITSTVPSVRMFLLAYSNGSYVGAWDGTAFSKTYVSTSNMTYIDVEKWLQDFPTYQFKIDFYGGASINPTDCQDALSITTVADALRQQTIELREHVNSVTSPYPLIEQGYWKVIDGTPNVSDTWCRTKTLNAAIALSTSDDIKMVLLAYNQQGEYVGAWNGSTFVKANYSPMAMLKYEFDMEEFSRQYLGYDFKIIFHRVSEATLTVQDVIDNVDVKSKFISTFNVASHILKSNKLYYFPVKTGNAFEVVSLSDVFANWRLKLYDANGEYLTYYNLPSGTSRKINSSSTDFEYVSIIAPLENIDVMVVNHSKPFDNDAFISALEAISTNRRDINVIQTLAQKYSKEKAEAETIVRKYGGNSAPVYADAFFMWITDVHQEVERTKDFADVVTKFGNDIVPFVLNTGDTVRAVIGDGITWYNDIIESMNVPVLNTVGNHDAYSSIGVLEPDKTVVYNEIIAPFVSEWGVTQPENAVANGYCYYYKDIGTVRLIVLDSEYWDSAQKIWLESVLADSTTNNKHVVIACHAPFSANLCTMIDTAWNTGFLSRDSRIMSAEALAAVQNFKSSGGVFVAWLQGHVHGDEVVTLDNGNQLAICNNSFSNRGTKVYKTNNKTNYNYNSYTMVAIDASNNLLKLYRIGANVSVTGKRHNGFVWNYNTNNLINEW